MRYTYAFQREKFMEKMDLLVSTIQKSILGATISVKPSLLGWLRDNLDSIQEKFIV